MSSDFKVQSTGIKEIIKNLLGQAPHVKVGILKEDSGREEDEMNNAEIGAVHEFGSIDNNIPRRSFLRDTIANEVPRLIEKVKLEKDLSIKQMLTKIGSIATFAVQESFTNNGYGKWVPTKEGKGKEKNSGNILVDTGQLSKSISFEVAE